ncbi:YkvA family protein [Belliella marina]|uniref:YkvA family protein n=1 Tax=Belliella marina TaxID=1644146 RepID=A0ABW4VKH9_9BACT
MASLKDKSVGFYERAKLLYLKKAQQVAGEEGKLKVLLYKSAEKIRNFSQNPNVQKAIEPILIFKRMIYAHKNGTHKLSAKTLGLLVLGLLYFVLPIDIIPDFLPIIGFADDVSVVIAIFNVLKNEIEDFLAWEKTLIKE